MRFPAAAPAMGLRSPHWVKEGKCAFDMCYEPAEDDELPFCRRHLEELRDS